MATEVANAISAYTNAAQRIGQDAGGGTGSAEQAPGTDFSSMLKQFADNAMATGKMSEQQSLAAAAGQADINEVVVAVAEAELTLNAVVAVRDKVISAYESIIRMPI